MQEYTKAAWEMTKTPELQAALGADIAEANKNVTHADFVAGVQNRTLGFKCMFGEPYQFIRGAWEGSNYHFSTFRRHRNWGQSHNFSVL
jgi:hypothetical protein